MDEAALEGLAGLAGLRKGNGSSRNLGYEEPKYQQPTWKEHEPAAATGSYFSKIALFSDH
jgi:hypothetical protein